MSGPAGRVIAPGRREHIEVAKNSLVKAGWCKGGTGERVSVRTNDPVTPRLVLVACAAVKDAMTTDPLPGEHGSFHFPQFSRRSTRETMTIRLLRGDGGPIHPELREIGFPRSEGSGRPWRIEPSQSLSAEVREVDPGERYELTVTARPPWPPWRSTMFQVVVATGVPEQPESKLNLWLYVEPRLRTEPTTLPESDKGSTVRAVARLVWSDDRPPGRVLAVEPDDSELLVEILETPQGQVLVVESRDEAYWARGLYRAREICMKVRTDDPEAPETRICVENASYRPPSDASSEHCASPRAGPP